ncbi:glutamyl-Q tRNA(Asp) synthetase [Gordonia araii NBRC 100433]|uniref:Glutamyl-Q tRNA(Asp) synthetase n=1 Tax=Gordonia araii NBRC 100433 TaxID=1073574 RepID=G7GXJ1_9ACTN|nr:tRNA glutamyl-Q(34) synthetase GluQRS [Gordonia araii]NNG98245.1 tRNA glutamyl-Q(34) synthetase GluQRS [Gordonia araii NBRC 100433]GAB08316.1 glutamyl-Q tRNA(Asp) synthetase [Gordonia araii NBRC 100433]
MGDDAGRYAPSPSGDLHVGNLRTALLAWLFARSTGRRFLMRMEDLDDRTVDGADARQLADLADLGLDWDPPMLYQSSRRDRYDAVIDSLTAAGRTFDCYCTRREILEAPRAPHAPEGAYPGTCLRLTDDELARRRETGRPPAIRLRTDVDEFIVDDGRHGSYSGTVDDFVLRRGDGTPAYNLAVVVDDAESGVEQVVRGDDLLASAPRQAYLATLLGYEPPAYWHVPLVVNAQGKRLSKRDGAVTLTDLAAQGVSAQDVLDAMARSLNLAAEAESVTAAQLLDRFDPAVLPREPWVWV